MPNSPRPSSRPSTYLSRIRVRWLSGMTSLRTRIGAGDRIGSSAYGLGLRSLVFFCGLVFDSLSFSSASGLTQALQFPIAEASPSHCRIKGGSWNFRELSQARGFSEPARLRVGRRATGGRDGGVCWLVWRGWVAQQWGRERKRGCQLSKRGGFEKYINSAIINHYCTFFKKVI